jgi:hypothetical protein
MRDDASVKVYPGIYIQSEQVTRMESNGVGDGNVFRIEWDTLLVTTPGEDSAQATSKAAHDALRDAAGYQIEDQGAEAWLDGQIGIRVFQFLVNSPETSEEDGYRVSMWKISAVACPI